MILALLLDGDIVFQGVDADTPYISRDYSIALYKQSIANLPQYNSAVILTSA